MRVKITRAYFDRIERVRMESGDIINDISESRAKALVDAGVATVVCPVKEDKPAPKPAASKAKRRAAAPPAPEPELAEGLEEEPAETLES